MRLQRYPEGGAYRWSLHIWGRHPNWSITWTHTVNALWLRPGSDERFAYIVYWPRKGQRAYGFKVWRLRVEMRRQKPLAWPVAAE